jgi:F-type H+-transporting ATPase subunit alpha
MLEQLHSDLLTALGDAREEHEPSLRLRELGTVRSVDKGIAIASGLPDVAYEEIVSFPGGTRGMVVDLEANRISIALLDEDTSIGAGTLVTRTGRVVRTSAGDGLLGRVVDPLGRPLDGMPAPRNTQKVAIERAAPTIMERKPVTRPLHTGITAIDSMVPIGRGQRELILGDRQTGKTSLVVDTILHQANEDIVCVYCSIGQQKAAVTRILDRFRRGGALDYTVVVLGDSDHPAGLRYLAPYSAMAIAEWFMERGRDVLIAFDDLTQHALSYRELSLLLRRPPGREAYPGDIFYVHSRLLERATQLRDTQGGGSITALPIVETEAEDISAYIPTNLISITDGQIYLSPGLAQRGQLPAVDVGLSVSRVGAKAQLPAYRAISGKLKLAYAQYEELEQFARFGTRMDPETRRKLEHGQRVRQLLRQKQYHTLRPAKQIAMLIAVTEGLLDHLPVDEVLDAGAVIRHAVDDLPEWMARVESGEKLDPGEHDPVRRAIRAAVGTPDESGEEDP